MKYFLIILVLFAGQAYGQVGLIFRDDAETDPPIPCPWCGTSKNTGWNVWTGGTQDYDNQDPENTWAPVSAGGGNPTPRKGTKSYKVYMERRDDLFGPDGDLNGALQHCRSELGWGSGCGQFTNARWFLISIFMPSTWCDDPVPVQIAYDMKFGDSQGPASMSLWAENGRYVIQQLNTQQGGATTNVQYTIPGAIGVTVKNNWVDFVVERNFKNDGTGFLRVYMKRLGTDSELQLVYSHTGPNYNMQCGTNSEAYLQHGLYKWAWQNTSNQGEGASNSCGYDPITIFYDNFVFLDATATLADVNAELSGGGAPTNQSPSVDAGPNQTITLPDTDAVMNGTTSDADGTIASKLWTKISGPTGGTISNTAIDDPTMSALQEGTYVFRLSATDDDGATSIDDVQIQVQSSTPPPTETPVFTDVSCTEELGEAECPNVPIPDITINLPVNSDSFQVRAVHKNGGGYIVMFAIAQIGSSPSVVTPTQFDQTGWIATVTNFGVSGLIEGTYTYEITVTDNDGTTAKDTMQIIVVGATNAPPTVNAGTDITLTLDGFGAFQVVSTTLNGVVSDADGAVASVQWIITQGPENSVFGSPTNDTTTFSGLIGGTYIARLIATDNDGESSFDNISVRVLTCNAGEDQVVALPLNTATLVGGSNSISDTTDVLWEKISGTGGNITSPNSLTTGITSLSAGVYEYQLTVTHTGGYVVRDRMKITVTGGTTTLEYHIKRGQ